MLIRAACLAALASLLAACFLVTDSSRVTPDYVARTEKVGVVALLAPAPNLSYLSTSALESRLARAPLPGWDANALALGTLLPRLGRKGLDARALTPDAALAAIGASDWREPGGEELAAAAYALGAARGLDLVVVVQPGVGEDFVTGTNQNVRGYGLQKAFDTGPYVYAAVAIQAYDVRKRFVVGRAEGRQHEPAAAELWDPGFEQGKAKTVDIGAGRGAQLAGELERLLVSALGVAAQEAGL